jgi:hypothetical protein
MCYSLHVVVVCVNVVVAVEPEVKPDLATKLKEIRDRAAAREAKWKEKDKKREEKKKKELEKWMKETEEEREKQKVWVRVTVGKYKFEARLLKRVIDYYRGSKMESALAWSLLFLYWLERNADKPVEIWHACFHDLLCTREDCDGDEDCPNASTADASDSLYEEALEGDDGEFREVKPNTPECPISIFGTSTPYLRSSTSLDNYITEHCTDKSSKPDDEYECENHQSHGSGSDDDDDADDEKGESKDDD